MFEYDGKKEWYQSITYTIMIRRRTLYYWSNLILPCVIIGKESFRIRYVISILKYRAYFEGLKNTSTFL